MVHLIDYMARYGLNPAIPYPHGGQGTLLRRAIFFSDYKIRSRNLITRRVGAF